jgi:hypothetical protein
MTDSERQQILKMIDEGKITAEEGLKLMQALNEDEPEDEAALEPVETVTGGEPASEKRGEDPYFASRINRFRSLWAIPLWVGVLITVGAAYWMYTSLQHAGFGFWFYCAWLPFLLGVAVVALAFSSRTSRWIYVNVKQKPGEYPQRIVITFPLALVSWILALVGKRIPANQKGVTDDVLRAIFDSTKSDEPFFVDVHDDDGEDVQVYIG